MRMSERAALCELPEYGVRDYLADVAAAANLAPAYRGAMMTAAKKRLKGRIAVQWVSLIAVEHDLDMTPTMAYKVVKWWLGRCAARPAIAARFALSGRNASHKSADSARIAELASLYRDRVIHEIDAAFTKAERAA